MTHPVTVHPLHFSTGGGIGPRCGLLEPGRDPWRASVRDAARVTCEACLKKMAADVEVALTFVKPCLRCYGSGMDGPAPADICPRCGGRGVHPP